MTAGATLFALVFARCAGFVSHAPGFAHPQVPRVVRAALAFVLAFGLAPALAPVATLSAGAFVAALVSEAVVGVAIGIGTSVLYDGLAAGANAVDDYVGVRAQNPGIVSVAGAGLGPAWALLAVAAFFVFGGYQLLLWVFADSFHSLPPASIVRPHAWLELATAVPIAVLRAALLIAGPAIVLGLVAHVMLGAIGRIVPRFSTLQLSWPLAFGLATGTTLVAIPLVAPLAGHPWLVLPMLRK